MWAFFMKEEYYFIKLAGNIVDIAIKKLQEEDFEKLYEFELENRAYFEQIVPGRGDDYYNYEIFKQRNKALIDEQNQGLSYFFLIKNKEDKVLGRMNLVDIDKSKGFGHIGYRVGKAYTGKGIASRALKLLLEKTTELGIRQILAKTTTNNKASQKVLEKSGFQHIATEDEEFNMNGQLVSFVYYKWEK